MLLPPPPPAGRYILSRDYMSLKLWDVNMDAGPLAVHSVHESLRGKVGGQLGRGWWWGKGAVRQHRLPGHPSTDTL